MRLFVAVQPGAGVIAALAGVLAALRREPTWRVVPAANLHVTCRFLGEVADERVPGLTAALRTLTVPPLALGVDGLGTFPERGPARVLWARLCGDLDALTRLAADVEARIVPLGFPTEARGFHPHLTLARARDGAPARAVPSAPVHAPPQPIAGCHLLASTQTAAGSVYRVVG